MAAAGEATGATAARRQRKRRGREEVDHLWGHAARLGYAWRRARNDLIKVKHMDTIWDLHAELLGRIGQKVRPVEATHPSKNMQRARRDVQDAVRYLQGVAAPIDTYDLAVACGLIPTGEHRGHTPFIPTGEAIIKDSAGKNIHIDGHPPASWAPTGGVIGQDDPLKPRQHETGHQVRQDTCSSDPGAPNKDQHETGTQTEHTKEYPERRGRKRHRDDAPLGAIPCKRT